MRPLNFYALTARFERRLVTRALRAANYNRAVAARLLGLNRTTLVMLAQRLGVDMPESPCNTKNRTTCLRGHPFDEVNTYHYRAKGQPRRRCRICHKNNLRSIAKRFNECTEAGVPRT